jgi:hypothetical protein
MTKDEERGTKYEEIFFAFAIYDRNLHFKFSLAISIRTFVA